MSLEAALLVRALFNHRVVPNRDLPHNEFVPVIQHAPDL